MKKKMISLLLVLALVVGICPAAFAAENDEKVDESAGIRDSFLAEGGLDDSELQKIWDEYNALSDEEAANYDIPFEIVDKYYALTKAEQKALDSLLEESGKDNVYAGQVARKIVGPYKDITTIPADYMEIVLNVLISNQGTMLNADVTYSGVQCYVFTQGSTQVYVAASAFYTEKNRVFPTAATVSNTLTSYMNNSNTSAVRSTHMISRKSVSGDGTYYMTITQVSSEVSGLEDSALYAKSEFNKSVYLVAGYDYLTSYSTNGRVSLQPELGVTMTSGGTNNTYFGGLDVRGVGASTNTTSIGSLIHLGYNVAAIFSGTFTFGTFTSVIGDVYTLAKTQQASDYLYTSATKQLSNPAQNKYTRDCKLQAPFKLTRAGNYYQMRIGLLNNNAKDAKYKVTVGYTFSG